MRYEAFFVINYLVVVFSASIRYLFEFGQPLYELPMIHDTHLGLEQDPKSFYRMVWDRIALKDDSYISSQITLAGPTWYPQPAEAYKFGELYPKAQHLLFAFDYGHALVYERLLQNRGQISNTKEFEKNLLADIRKILLNPPTVKVDESEIAPNYVFTFPLMEFRCR